MRAKIGDVVIDRTYNKKGNLAIVVGEGISQPILIDHKGGIMMDKLRDYFAVWDGLEVIGHIDFEGIWEEAVRKADRKTEPQTCEECKHYLFTDIDGYYCEHETYGQPCNYEPKDKPQTCSTCKFDHEKWFEAECDSCCDAHSNWKPKDEPQTDCSWR